MPAKGTNTAHAAIRISVPRGQPPNETTPTVNAWGSGTQCPFLARSGGSLHRSDTSAIGGIADLPGLYLKLRY